MLQTQKLIWCYMLLELRVSVISLCFFCFIYSLVNYPLTCFQLSPVFYFKTDHDTFPSFHPCHQTYIFTWWRTFLPRSRIIIFNFRYKKLRASTAPSLTHTEGNLILFLDSVIDITALLKDRNMSHFNSFDLFTSITSLVFHHTSKGTWWISLSLVS
jgi:hypothetical protein